MLATHAERTGFAETGRYDEVVALGAGFASRHPAQVRCIEFGRTPEGRPMLALAVTRTGVLDAATARERALPVTLVQAGIHAGEIEGKDAGFLAVRQLLEGEAAPGALERQVLLFVPVVNVDGHERFGEWNRPNQRGPKAMGWRTTAQNLNLNRDYAKAESPEMQAMLALVRAWDPLACIDIHATDGAQFEHDVSIQVEPGHAGDDALRPAGRALRDGVIAALAAHGSLPQPFYMAFDVEADPASGFTDGVSPPRFSTGYFHLRNRFAMLVECHSWKDYATRVRIAHRTSLAVVEQVAAHGAAWRRLAREADERAAALAGTPVPLDWRATERSRLVEFRGYAYARTPSEVSGAPMTRYDETRPEVWRVPLRDDVQPHRQAVAPQAGYLVPPAHAASVGDTLAHHGIASRALASDWPRAPVQTFRADRATWAAQPAEGRLRLSLEGAWRDEPQDVAAGALFVPVAQPLARLAMALLEPEAPDSLVAWGRFNAHYEVKEYMEPYVAEAVAREQLAADPALAQAFARRVAEDAAFAADPVARLDFFHRRHPSWDDRLGLYPVLRLDTLPP